MTAGNADLAAEPPIFTAVLKPHRSLPPAGFMLVMMVLVACSFTAGLVFWLMGAWPIVGFFGLDVALVQLAFRLNYRAARAEEEVTVTQDRLLIRRTNASGRTVEVGFNPYWARLEIDRHPEIGVTGVRVTSHGTRFSLAGFLGPRERERFAAELQAALNRAKAAPAPG